MKSLKLLHLADRIENLDPDSFDMARWDMCACGQAMRMNAIIPRWQYTAEESYALVGWFGEKYNLTHDEARLLVGNSNQTPDVYAKQLRHFVATNEWLEPQEFGQSRVIHHDPDCDGEPLELILEDA